MFDHSRLGLENKFFSKQNNLVTHHLNFKRLIHSLPNQFVGETMDNWTASKSNFMKHTIVLGGSQFTRCTPLSKREAKFKKKKIRPDFLFDKFTSRVNLADKSDGV